MVSVLIPAHNECERIAETLASVRGLMLDFQQIEIIVVDDGSSDDTASISEAAGANVVLRQANAGKGAALQSGFLHSKGEIVLLLDADLGSSAGEAAKLLAPVLKDEADMTIAMFPVVPGKGGGIGLVVRLARWGIRCLTGRTMAAPLSGQRALKREIIETCGGFASGWGVEIALTVHALKAGFRVQEVPSTMTHRVTGRSICAVLHRAAQFRSAFVILARLWLMSRRQVPIVRRNDTE